MAGVLEMVQAAQLMAQNRAAADPLQSAGNAIASGLRKGLDPAYQDERSLQALKLLETKAKIDKMKAETADYRATVDFYKAKGMMPLNYDEKKNAQTVANEGLGVTSNDYALHKLGASTQIGKVTRLYFKNKEKDFKQKNARRDDYAKRQQKVWDQATIMAENEAGKDYAVTNDLIKKYLPEAAGFLYSPEDPVIKKMKLQMRMLKNYHKDYPLADPSQPIKLKNDSETLILENMKAHGKSREEVIRALTKKGLL